MEEIETTRAKIAGKRVSDGGAQSSLPVGVICREVRGHACVMGEQQGTCRIILVAQAAGIKDPMGKQPMEHFISTFRHQA